MNKPKNNYKPGAQDICGTPPHALEPLFPYLNLDHIIWESACGPEFLLAQKLLDIGFKVRATDITQYELWDFFTYQPKAWDIQITNPPFSLKYEWLQRSFELGKPFALLCPFETLTAAKFQKLFKQYNQIPWSIDVLGLERRINFKMPNLGWAGSGAQMPTCWITWGLQVEDHYIGLPLKIYYSKLRSAKYDENDQEIV